MYIGSCLELCFKVLKTTVEDFVSNQIHGQNAPVSQKNSKFIRLVQFIFCK